MVCMASFLSLNGRNSAYFDNDHTKFPTHAYFEMSLHSILSKCENSKKYIFMTSSLINSIANALVLLNQLLYH